MASECGVWHQSIVWYLGSVCIAVVSGIEVVCGIGVVYAPDYCVVLV